MNTKGSSKPVVTHHPSPLFEFEKTQAENARVHLVALSIYPTSNEPCNETHAVNIRSGIDELLAKMEFADIVAMYNLARLLCFTPEDIPIAFEMIEERNARTRTMVRAKVNPNI